MPGGKSRPEIASQEPWLNGGNMRESGITAKEFEERARKRESIGLSPQRPTARTDVHSPPEARRGVPVTLLAFVVLTALAAAAVLWRPALFWLRPIIGPTLTETDRGRLIASDDFAEPKFTLIMSGAQDSDQRYIGDLYRIQVSRTGGRVWATLGQLNLGAHRLEAVLHQASEDPFAWGYGRPIARFRMTKTSISS